MNPRTRHVVPAASSVLVVGAWAVRSPAQAQRSPRSPNISTALKLGDFTAQNSLFALQRKYYVRHLPSARGSN